MLKKLLDLLKHRDAEKVLITCDCSNAASARVIEKNGGIFESEIISPYNGEKMKRYWVYLK